jgi:predicted O-methyltransferase YrrM
MRADSHSHSTLECLGQLLNGKHLDFLFIDADHTYEGVKMDFLMYWPLVREEGLVALHDIVPHLSHPDFGVGAFWKELRQLSWTIREIVKDWKRSRAGIGVVFKMRHETST